MGRTESGYKISSEWKGLKKEKQRIGVEFRNGFDADFLRSLVLFIHFRINERSE